MGKTQSVIDITTVKNIGYQIITENKFDFSVPSGYKYKTNKYRNFNQIDLISTWEQCIEHTC